MTQRTVRTIHSKAADFPERLRHISTTPGQLYVLGEGLAEIDRRPTIAIVGSRKITPYGKTVTTQLADALAGAGMVVISGLAIGVDGVAHRATLDAGGLTVAVLAGGLDSIHPSSHYQLAMRIVAQGGALISEYPPGTPPYKPSFIARNRIVSGLADAVLITEATELSGTLHTARFALEQGKEVLAVPGNITSQTSAGTNKLIKAGATPVTCIEDIFRAIGVQQPTERAHMVQGSTPDEQTILDLMIAGESDGQCLLERSQLDVVRFNQSLTMLEITGKVRSLGANHWTIN